MFSRLKKNLTDDGRIDTSRVLQFLAVGNGIMMFIFIAFAVVFLIVQMLDEKKWPTEQLESLGAFIGIGFGISGAVTVAFSTLYQYKRKIKNGGGNGSGAA